MAVRKAIGMVLLCCVLIGGASVAVSAVKDSVVQEVYIDDSGVKVGDRQYHAGRSERYRGRVQVIGEDVVRFGDDIIIEEDEAVDGDVVAIFGSIIVDGTVDGNVVAIFGELTVGPTGEIDGDGVSVGGNVTKEPGGVIRGETTSVGFGPDYLPRRGVFRGGFFRTGGRLLLFVVWTIVLIVLGLIIVAIARGPVERVCTRARKEAFKMGLIGLLAEVLLIPVCLLFIITIIGIPVGVLVLPLVFALALLLGYVGVSVAVGGRIGNGSEKSVYMSVALGIFVLQGLAILGGILKLPGGPIGFVGTVINVIGWAVIYVAATVGLGAVIMSKFGTKGYEAKPAVAPAGVGMGPVGGGVAGTGAAG
jgi:hypothetical protein